MKTPKFESHADQIARERQLLLRQEFNKMKKGSTDAYITSVKGNKAPDYDTAHSTSVPFYPQLRVKKISDKATIPTKSYGPSEGGYDLYAANTAVIKPGSVTKIKTGIALEIPLGYSGFIWPRSSMGSNGTDVYGGLVDSSYRGEIVVCIYNGRLSVPYIVECGERCAQITIQQTPHFELIEVDELDKTNRGDAGLGSSGK